MYRVCETYMGWFDIFLKNKIQAMDADMAAIRLRVDALDAAIPCEMLCPISSDIMRAFA